MRRFVLLDKNKHAREHFTCGVKELDDYLQKFALQDIKRNLARVFVSLEANDEISGYYTLSPTSIKKDNIPFLEAKKLPNYPLPAILIGRLAVNQGYQGKGVGAQLLVDALKRIFEASQTTFGIYAVIVDAKDERAKSFYTHFGFTCFTDKPNTLFLPMRTIEKLFNT